jgi:ribosomal protein L28
MSNRCQICDKSKQFGEQSRHHRGVAGKQWSKRAQRTLKIFKPNLQWATIDGLRIKVCSKCRKLIVKDVFVKPVEKEIVAK